MELKYLLLFGFVHSVVATPTGYGVKAGAVARAGAVAGVFPGVANFPGGISGAGAGAAAVGGAGSFGVGGADNNAAGNVAPGSYSLSGSFSKSSASSFASSSANSYSFSQAGGYSGTAPYPGGHATPTGVSGSNTAIGADSSVNSAISAAGAGSLAFGAAGYPGVSGDGASSSNSKCNTPGCENSINKQSNTNYNKAQAASNAGSGAATGFESGVNCASGACNTENKCTSGNCGPKTPSKNENDIYVNIPPYQGTKTSYDADAQSQYYNLKGPGNSGQPNSCINGKCDESGTNVNAESNTGSQNNFQPQENQKCSGPNCNNGYPIPVQTYPPYRQPSTVLTTPVETPPKTEPCTSGNCANIPTGPYPIYTQSPNKGPCAAGNCGTSHISGASSASNSNAASNSFDTSYNVNLNLKPQDTKCTSPNCGVSIENGPNIPSNNYPQGQKCTSPNCKSNPQYNSNYPNNPHGPSILQPAGANCGSPNCGNPAGAHANAGATSINQPSYTGGFGAPPGFLKPNDFASKPSYIHPHKTIESGNYPAVGVVTGQAPNNQPSYTGGFGGPTGILKPTDHAVPTNPGFIQQQPTGIPKQPTQAVSTQSTGTSNDGELNFVPLKPNKNTPAGNHYVQNQVGSASNAAAGANVVVYTGGFGGPPGLLKPYDNGEKPSPFVHKLTKPGSNSYSNDFNNRGSTNAGGNYNVPSGNAIGVGSFAGAGAVAGAGAGAYNNGGYYDKQSSHYNGASNHNGETSGNFAGSNGYNAGTNGYNSGTKGYNAGSSGSNCGGGCGGAGSGGLGGNHGFNLGGSFGLSKTGLFDGLAGGLNAAGAAAKSIAGAVSSAGIGSGSLGLSGSFAGSAAHASSGSIAKGGYSR